MSTVKCFGVFTNSLAFYTWQNILAIHTSIHPEHWLCSELFACRRVGWRKISPTPHLSDSAIPTRRTQATSTRLLPLFTSQTLRTSMFIKFSLVCLSYWLINSTMQPGWLCMYDMYVCVYVCMYVYMHMCVWMYICGCFGWLLVVNLLT